MVPLSQRARQLTDSPTVALTARARALRLEGLEVVGLDADEAEFDTPEPIRRAGIEAIEEGFTRYTPAAGMLALRQAVAADLTARHGAPFDAAELLVSCGTRPALYTALLALLDPGDEVLVPAPYSAGYPELVRLAGGVPLVVPAGLDAGELERRIGERTRALLVNSPCNPTGAVAAEEQLSALAELVTRRGLLVLSDERYERLVHGEARHVSLVARYGLREQGVIVGGVSQSHAMSGWRIGWAAGPAELVAAMCRIQRHAAGCPGSIAQRAALAAFGESRDHLAALLRELDQRRMYAVSRLKDIGGIALDEPAGAFYVFPRVSRLYGKRAGERRIDGSTGFAEALLEQQGVAVVPGAEFGADEHVRLTYAVSDDLLEQGLDRFEEFVGRVR